MTKAIRLTAADTASHNLYALILAALGITQLPQRVDTGAVFFPDPVATVTFSLPISEAGNSGQHLSAQDQDGNEMQEVITGIPYVLGTGNALNDIYLQGLKIQASASGVVTDVSIIVN